MIGLNNSINLLNQKQRLSQKVPSIYVYNIEKHIVITHLTSLSICYDDLHFIWIFTFLRGGENYFDTLKSKSVTSIFEIFRNRCREKILVLCYFNSSLQYCIHQFRWRLKSIFSRFKLKLKWCHYTKVMSSVSFLFSHPALPIQIVKKSLKSVFSLKIWILAKK